MGAHRSDVELLALHAVRLRGMATPAAAAARFGLDRDVVGELLEDFAAFGWVRYDEFAGTGGCFELHEDLLATLGLDRGAERTSG